jgi:hypothetical protein
VSAAAAWMLDFGAGCLGAVGAREQMHLVHQPKVHAVPSAPGYCRHIFLLGDLCLPVLDVSALVQGTLARPQGLLGIYGYYGADGQSVELGALWLAAPPRSIRVEDAESAELPGPAWHGIAHACFTHQGVATPVLDLSRVFAPSLPD